MAFTTTDQHESGKSANLSATARVEREKARPLHGMKAICAYLGVSENTARKYIKEEGLPVGRIGGGLVSDEEKIDTWRLNRIV